MKISRRLRLMTLLLVLVIASSVGFSIFRGYAQLLDDQQREALGIRVESEARRMTTALEELRHDVRALQGLPEVWDVVRTASEVPPPRSRDVARERIATVFEQMMLAKPNYLQLRLIGIADEGRELVRVDRTDGVPRRVPEEELQAKGQREYFLRTIVLPRNQLRFSDVTLNREHGVLEEPHTAMLRAAMPVYDGAPEPLGIVVINLGFQGLVRELFAADLGRYRVYVANEGGHYLFHPEADRAFGFELGAPYRIQDEFPGISVPGSRDVADTVAASERLVRFQPLDLVPGSGDRRLILGISANYEDVSERAFAIARNALVLTVLLLGGALLGSYFLATLLVRPLAQITSAAENLSAGSGRVPLPVDRDDEIGRLAREFDTMVSSLREKERNLLSANQALRAKNEELEHFSHIASHHLREPARRASALTGILQFELGEHGSDRVRQVLDRLRRTASRMLDQLTSYRVFSNLGQGEWVSAPVSVEGLMQVVLEERATTLEARGVRSRVASTPVVSANEDLVRVLLSNLVSNALTHTADRGFSLELSCDPSGAIPVFGVRNTGSRLDPAVARRIFDAFEAFDPEGEGIGLGLAICRRIVDRHGGRIWVESDDDSVHVRFTLTGAS